ESEISDPGREIIETIDKDATRSDQEQPATRDPLPAALLLTSLDAFRPLGDRAPEPQIAEAQRREFFAQLHRWLRQGHAVHVFCNNDGERQRFNEIWKDYVLGTLEPASSAPQVYRADPSHQSGPAQASLTESNGRLGANPI